MSHTSDRSDRSDMSRSRSSRSQPAVLGCYAGSVQYRSNPGKIPQTMQEYNCPETSRSSRGNPSVRFLICFTHPEPNVISFHYFKVISRSVNYACAMCDVPKHSDNTPHPLRWISYTIYFITPISRFSPKSALEGCAQRKWQLWGDLVEIFQQTRRYSQASVFTHSPRCRASQPIKSVGRRRVRGV